MIKRFFWILFSLALLLAIALSYLWTTEDLAPGDIPAAISLATGMGAKLACSSHYLSGFDGETIEDDLATYSDMMRSVRFTMLPNNVVEASLYGLSSQARYREGLGCTLEPGAEALDAVQPAAPGVSKRDTWPRGSAEGDVDPAIQSLVETLLQKDNAAGQRTRALLVVQDGAIKGEAYGPGIARSTPLLGWSMGKSVTAMMVGRLQAMGEMNAVETALFPAWANDPRTAISLENMLNMTSGLDFVEDYVPGSDSTKMLFRGGDVSAIPVNSAAVYEPGTHFSYSSGTTNLLARLVFERVGASAQAQYDFFLREFAKPLALENTILEPDALGVPIGSSYVYASARDWARFGQLMLNGGELNGRRVLSADWVERAAQPNQSSNYRAYGYQFWLNRGNETLTWNALPADAYAMQGNRKQVVMIVPSQRAVLVRLGWSAGEYPTGDNFAQILAALEP